MAKTNKKMPKYTIAYDLHGVTDRSKWEHINNDILTLFPSSAKLLNTTFYISTSLNTQQVSDKVKTIMAKHVGPTQFEYIVFSVDGHNGWIDQDAIVKVQKVNNVSPINTLRR